MTWLITCPACRLLLTPLHRLPHAITKQGSLPQFITIQRANASSPGVPTFERLCKVMCGSFYAPYINFHPLIHVTVFSGTKHQTLCSLWWWGTKIQEPTPSLVSPSLLLFVSLSWSSPSLSQLNHVHYCSPTVQSIDYTINHPSLSLLVIFLPPPPVISLSLVLPLQARRGTLSAWPKPVCVEAPVQLQTDNVNFSLGTFNCISFTSTDTHTYDI